MSRPPAASSKQATISLVGARAVVQGNLSETARAVSTRDRSLIRVAFNTNILDWTDPKLDAARIDLLLPLAVSRRAAYSSPTPPLLTHTGSGTQMEEEKVCGQDAY